MAELEVWRQLRRALVDLDAEGVRIEDKTRSGVPDVSLTLRGDFGVCSGWLELKDVEEGSGDLGLRTTQARFLHRWSRKGYAGILARRVVGGVTEWRFIPARYSLWWMQCVLRDPFGSAIEAATTVGERLSPEWLLGAMLESWIGLGTPARVPNRPADRGPLR